MIDEDDEDEKEPDDEYPTYNFEDPKNKVIFEENIVEDFNEENSEEDLNEDNFEEDFINLEDIRNHNRNYLKRMNKQKKPNPENSFKVGDVVLKKVDFDMNQKTKREKFSSPFEEEPYIIKEELNNGGRFKIKKLNSESYSIADSSQLKKITVKN